MLIKSNIRKLRIVSFLLFIVPTIALLGSLIIHNYLLSFSFVHHEVYNFKKNIPGDMFKIPCSKENNYCDNVYFKQVDKLNKCNKYLVDVQYVSATGDLLDINKDKPSIDVKNLNQDVFVKFEILDRIDNTCILNSNSIKYYNFIPFLYEKIFELKKNKKTNLGTSQVVNPIIYGETSISNIVKRFPVKFFFKPLMYLGVFFMICYWMYYNSILNTLFKKKGKNTFLIFGILSAIFLLLHVFFLGWSFENEILTKLRRSLIVFFILFEVLAQGFLINDIFKRKSEILEYINYFIVYSKLVFVFFVCFSTMIILSILIFFDLDNKIDYILEWNYFLFLLFFYFLSFLMWKKNI